MSCKYILVQTIEKESDDRNRVKLLKTFVHDQSLEKRSDMVILLPQYVGLRSHL